MNLCRWMAALLALGVVTLGGCGFQPRGALPTQSQATPLPYLEVVADRQEADLEFMLRRALITQGFAREPGQAAAVRLKLLATQQKETALSYDQRIQAAEYRLVRSVSYRLVELQGKERSMKLQVSAERNYPASPQNPSAYRQQLDDAVSSINQELATRMAAQLAKLCVAEPASCAP